MKKILLLLAAASAFCLLPSCKGKDDPDPTPEPVVEKSTECSLTALTVTAGSYTLEGVIYEKDKVVELIYLPEQHASLASATAVATISDKATIKPDPSVAADYTKDVTYTVTAEDGKTEKKYTVKAVAAQTVVKVAKTFESTFAAMGAAPVGFMCQQVAFCDVDKFATFDKQVFDLSGKKVGDLNVTGIAANAAFTSMSNDDAGRLFVLAGTNADGGTPTGGDDIIHVEGWIWMGGYDKAPTKIFSDNQGIGLYMNASGDAAKGTFLFTAIAATGHNVTHQHNMFIYDKGEMSDNNYTWAPCPVPLPSNDGNWGQSVCAIDGRKDGAYFIWDSQGGGVGAYYREGTEGDLVQLRGTQEEYGGNYGYGNYSTGNVRGFRFNNTPYVVVASSGWASSYLTIQDNKPDGGDDSYLLKTTVFSFPTPFPSCAYVFDPAKDTGHIIVCFGPENAYIGYDVTREII